MAAADEHMESQEHQEDISDADDAGDHRRFTVTTQQVIRYGKNKIFVPEQKHERWHAPAGLYSSRAGPARTCPQTCFGNCASDLHAWFHDCFGHPMLPGKCGTHGFMSASAMPWFQASVQDICEAGSEMCRSWIV